MSLKVENTMKTNRVVVSLLASCVVIAITSWTPRAYAVMGVADTTIISGDLTDIWKWPRELTQWTQLIEQTTEEIRRTDELIKIAGHPDEVMQKIIESVPDLMEPVDKAIGLETRLEALRAAQSLYALNAVSVQIYNDANKVLPAYDAFGEKIKRDPNRYKRFVLQEAMGARYKQAIVNKELVDKSEAKAQRATLEKLKLAKTTTEIAGLEAALSASKQRQDLAHQKAEQAKSELDAFNGQLLVEDARKAEADREWAQTVVERMRAKALAAYQAQTGTSASETATE
jgi:hypothetical protein